MCRDQGNVEGILMEGNRLCSLCGTEPAGQFCICSSLPLFCVNCCPTHEAKPAFHFALPIAALDYVTPQNQQQYKHWLISLQNSHEKLSENIPKIGHCRREIEALFGHIQADFIPAKAIQTLEELRARFIECVDQAIKETCENAYLLQYKPISHLAKLIWSHSSQQSSDPIPAFTYQIETFQHFIGISFQTPIPELAHLNYEGKLDIWKEIADLKAKVLEAKQSQETLIAQGKEREERLIAQLTAQAKAREALLMETLQRIESREAQLSKEIETLKTQMAAGIERKTAQRTRFVILLTICLFSVLFLSSYQKFELRMKSLEIYFQQVDSRSSELQSILESHYEELQTVIEGLESRREQIQAKINRLETPFQETLQHIHNSIEVYNLQRKDNYTELKGLVADINRRLAAFIEHLLAGSPMCLLAQLLREEP